MQQINRETELQKTSNIFTLMRSGCLIQGRVCSVYIRYGRQGPFVPSVASPCIQIKNIYEDKFIWIYFLKSQWNVGLRQGERDWERGEVYYESVPALRNIKILTTIYVKKTNVWYLLLIAQLWKKTHWQPV